jgi:hypothetical protein
VAKSKKNGTKHGHTWVRKNGTVGRSPTYQSWRSMLARCYYDQHPWFHAYGERGIQVTDRWRGKEGFVNFLADMGERPNLLLTLDREDVDGDYYKGNCRWADKSVQRTNIRNLQPLPKPSPSKRQKPKPKIKKRRKPIRAPARIVDERSIRDIPF